MTIAGDVFAKSTTATLDAVAVSFNGEKFISLLSEEYEWHFSDGSCITVDKFGHGYGTPGNTTFWKEQK